MIDGNISGDLLIQNLHELEFLNRNFGGHAATLFGLKKFINDRNRTYHIIDLGCGGGDTMIHIAEWGRRKNLKIRLTGIDRNPLVIDYMKQKCSGYPEITGMVSDYRRLLKSKKTADIMHCSLFCHHLTDEEIVDLLVYFRKSARIGFVINDLIRSRLAYYLVKILTSVANGSEVSRNDGPVSVLRGFNFHELNMFMKRASITKYQISPKWAFRVVITGYADVRNSGINQRSRTGRPDDGMSAD